MEFHETTTRSRFSHTTTIDHQDYDILVREEDTGNVLTDPIFYCPIGNLKRVISVIEGDAKIACDDFRILKKVIEPAEFKRVSKEDFVEYLHMGVHRLVYCDYQRIPIYQSPSETGVKNLTQLAETAPFLVLGYKVIQGKKGLRFENDNRRTVLIRTLSVLQ